MPEKLPIDPRTQLDHLDRQLLAQLDADPIASVTAYAAALGVSAHTAARRLARLEHAGMVRVVGRTLPGFGGQQVRLVRAKGAPSILTHYGHLFAGLRQTRWVRLSSAGTELTSGFVGDPCTHDDALERLVSDARLREVQVHELLHVWGQSGAAVLTAPRDLDALDRAILRELQQDGRQPVAAIAAALRVDASTVSRRRRRLVAEGVLYFEADIHPAARSRLSDLMLWIQVAPGHIRGLGSHLRALPGVGFVAATTGCSTLVAQVATADGPAELEFLDTALADFPVLALETVPMHRVFKRSA